MSKNSYTIDNKEYIAVSSVLSVLDKPALMYWAINCMSQYLIDHAKKKGTYFQIDTKLIEKSKKDFRSVSKTALDIGSQVHSLVSEYIITGKDLTHKKGISDAALNGFLAFLDFEKTHGIKWLASEMTVYQKHAGYAGTIDALAEINGKKVLVDFKTSKAIYDDYIFQVSAYMYAYSYCRGSKAEIDRKVGGEKKKFIMEYPDYLLDYAMIVRFDKETGSFEYKEIQQEILLKYYEAFWTLNKFVQLKNNL